MLSWVYWTLTATYVLSIITVIVVIIGENRNPLKSLAWVTVLILLPAVGLVLYIFFGRSIKNKRMISRRNKRRLRRRESFHAPQAELNRLSAENRQLVHLATTLTGSTFYPGNATRVYTDGAEKFAALKQDLRSATQFIHLQYYIFEDDALGTEIADILKDKARQGVKVRVIYDHIGSIHVKSGFFKSMAEAGVEIYPFFRVRFTPFASRINWRNHRKIVVVDGRVGYIGGMNIADRYLDGGKKFALWRDCHIRIEGPAVSALHNSFAVDWTFMQQPLPDEECDVTVRGDDIMHLVTAGPMNRWHNVAHAFHHAIASARQRVWLQTPYFLPTESLLKALQSAALAGVDVRVMLPRHSDSALLVHASASYITECMQAGIKLYFFEPGMLHSKVLIVDDEFSSVGSTNFDFRSFEHNFEANMLIFSPTVNLQLRELFVADMKQSTRVRRDEWDRRPWPRKIAESLTRLLSPVL